MFVCMCVPVVYLCFEHRKRAFSAYLELTRGCSPSAGPTLFYSYSFIACNDAICIYVNNKHTHMYTCTTWCSQSVNTSRTPTTSASDCVSDLALFFSTFAIVHLNLAVQNIWQISSCLVSCTQGAGSSASRASTVVQQQPHDEPL